MSEAERGSRPHADGGKIALSLSSFVETRQSASDFRRSIE